MRTVCLQMLFIFYLSTILEARKCRRPTGKIGDTFTKKCKKYTCQKKGKKAIWKSVPDCCSHNGKLYERLALFHSNETLGCPEVMGPKENQLLH